jgi:hypothetical protein
MIVENALSVRIGAHTSVTLCRKPYLEDVVVRVSSCVIDMRLTDLYNR